MAEPKVKPNKIPLFSMDRIGTTIDGKFMNAKQEAAYKANKTKGSRGPRTRGGKRGAQAETALMVAKPAPVVVKPAKTKAKAAAAKATTTMTKGSMKRTAIPKAEIAVKDIKQTIAPMTSTGIAKTKRNISVGGLVGRTGGKWHLGKKVGKG